MKAFLILADGHIFEGKSIGSRREIISELVFNTSMTGYLEVLTDPSYAGQAVCMTYPLIGNYGICHEDEESIRPWLDGYIVRELSKTASNFRCEDTLSNYLKRFDITGICGIDTRQLTKILRENGTMNCMITTDEHYNLVDIIPKLKEYTTGHVVEKVTCSEKYVLEALNPEAKKQEPSKPEAKKPEAKKREASELQASSVNTTKTTIAKTVALLDLGAKKNIAKSLAKRGCNVMVYPATAKAEEILAKKPDGILLSNGPGDPAVCTDIIAEIKKLYASDIPIFAICLGHQLMALATGAKTKKMKYGHRGGNHPVKDLETGRVYISSQNHGYVVDTDTIDKNIAAPAFVNVNDGTNEGLKYIGKNIFTVQFHPEACPGPQDSAYLFDRFIDMMGGQRLKKQN